MLAEDEYVLELAEASEFSDRKNLSIYFKLVEICKEINKDEALKKKKRNVSVI
mgnify:FL=1